MVIKASYKTLGEYLKAIDALPIIFTIEEISIERTEETEEEVSKKKEEPKKVIARLLISNYTVWKI